MRLSETEKNLTVQTEPESANGLLRPCGPRNDVGAESSGKACFDIAEANLSWLVKQ